METFNQNTEMLEPMRRAHASAGIFLDFDGTMAEIVGRPEAARPFPGLLPALEELASSYEVVAVLSGRPTRELRRLVPLRSVEVFGHYGLTGLSAGKHLLRGVFDEVTRIAGSVPGAWVEDKGPTIAVHYRSVSDSHEPERLLEPPLRELAERNGLGLLSGKKVLELVPANEPGKGEAILREALARGISACLYAGDDLADLDAFQALERLRDRDVHAVRVAVRTEETPEELCRQADIVVDRPAGLLTLLESLLIAPRSSGA